MDALEAIRSRRMIPRVGAEPPTREQIAELLELAVRAPNHHRSEPWRFYVLAGEQRTRIARVIAHAAIEGGANSDRAMSDAIAKVDRAPVIVVFTCVTSDDPKVIEQEDVVSVAMAMENFLIGAHAMGLGAMLRTGTAAYHPSTAEELDLAAGERVIGMIYLGLPAADRPLTERAPASERTTWLA